MSSGFHYHVIVWVALAVVAMIGLGRTIWVYRGSANWPVVEGTITGLDVQQRRDAGGPLATQLSPTNSRTVMVVRSPERGTRISQAMKQQMTSPQENYQSANR